MNEYVNPLTLPISCVSLASPRNQHRASSQTDHITNNYIQQVANNDGDTPTSPRIPISPPPSFRSRASSPTSRHHEPVDQNLADTFDADGSDSDEENDGDDRQRLMRGTPSTSSAEAVGTIETATTDGERPAPSIERRATYLPVFAAPTTGRVYGGGSASDGVFANLSAKPETGEKTEEHPPVRPSSVLELQILTHVLDIRTSSSRCRTALLGNHDPGPRPWRSRRCLRGRPPRRLRLLIRLERHDINVVPTRWLPPHLPSPHHPRRQERLSRRPWHHSCPIRLLHERFQLVCSIPSSKWSRSRLYSTPGPKLA